MISVNSSSAIAMEEEEEGSCSSGSNNPRYVPLHLMCDSNSNSGGGDESGQLRLASSLQLPDGMSGCLAMLKRSVGVEHRGGA